MSLFLSVFYQKPDESVPLCVESGVGGADKIVAVYYYGRNASAPSLKIFDGEDGMHGVAEFLYILPAVELAPVKQDDDRYYLQLRPS